MVAQSIQEVIYGQIDIRQSMAIDTDNRHYRLVLIGRAHVSHRSRRRLSRAFPIPGSWFGYPAQASQAFHSSLYMWTKYALKLPRRHPLEVKCMAHLKRNWLTPTCILITCLIDTIHFFRGIISTAENGHLLTILTKANKIDQYRSIFSLLVLKPSNMCFIRIQ